MRSELEMILSEKIVLITVSSDSPLSLPWSLEIVTCMNIVVKTEFMKLYVCMYAHICACIFECMCENTCMFEHACVFNCM